VRAFARFLGAILIAGLIGAAIAYPAFELTSRFASWPFHRVWSRIAMLALAFTLAWACRRLRLNTKRDFGYGLPWARFLTLCLLWGAVGVATAGVGAAFLLWTQLRIGVSLSGAYVLTALGSGIAVALIEESV